MICTYANLFCHHFPYKTQLANKKACPCYIITDEKNIFCWNHLISHLFKNTFTLSMKNRLVITIILWHSKDYLFQILYSFWLFPYWNIYQLFSQTLKAFTLNWKGIKPCPIRRFQAIAKMVFRQNKTKRGRLWIPSHTCNSNRNSALCLR